MLESRPNQNANTAGSGKQPPSSLEQLHANKNGLSLGPDLPFPVYQAMEPWHVARIRALALYCSDGRWGDAFDEFCQKHLHMPRYDRWAVPGGPAWLVKRAEDSTLLKAARTQIDFLVTAHQLEHIVLITHYGCAAYTERLRKTPDECLTAQIDEVKIATDTLHEWFPNMHVISYLAMRRDQALTFHELNV